MDEAALRQHLQARFPKENAGCEWKEFKNLKHAVSGDKGGDIISYVPAIANTSLSISPSSGRPTGKT